MTIVYEPYSEDTANSKDIPSIYVTDRSRGRKWKWIVDIDSIWIDERDKDQFSESAVKEIHEKARELDSEAQTPDSAKFYSDREEIWNLSKSHSQGIFRLVFREKEVAIKLADFVAEMVEEEFDVEVSA